MRQKHGGRGEVLAQALAREGVDITHLIRDGEAPTGVALVQVEEGGRKQIQTLRGANWRLTEADVRNAAGAIRSARVLLAQLEVPVEVVAEALRVAREAGVRTVLDPAPPAGLGRELLRAVDVIKPNAAEAEALTGIAVRDRASARRAADDLVRCGVGAVAVEAGHDGNLIVWAEGERWLPRIGVLAVDETGAGDAFAAALAVMLVEGRSLEEAGSFASAAAALTATGFGAQAPLPRREAVLELLAKSSGVA